MSLPVDTSMTQVRSVPLRPGVRERQAEDSRPTPSFLQAGETGLPWRFARPEGLDAPAETAHKGRIVNALA